MQTCIAIGIGTAATPRPRQSGGGGLTLRFGVPLLMAEMHPLACVPLMRAGIIAGAGGFDSGGIVGPAFVPLIMGFGGLFTIALLNS
jgi:hypothetical protein